MDKKVYLTITQKPIGIAAAEKLAAVEASVFICDIQEAHLADLFLEAVRRLDDSTSDTA